MSTTSSTATLASEDLSYTRRPWRTHVTPWSHIISHTYSGEGTEESPYIVDWIPGTDDKNHAVDSENPMTWGNGQKWRVVLTCAFATLAVALTSSCLSGAETSIEETFPGYKTQAYVMVTSGFVLGFVVGPLLWAPLSELYGRRYLFVGTYLGFTIFNGGVIASQNIWTMIILRFFAGTFGSSPLTNAGGTVADVFDAKTRGLGMAVFAAAPFMGPALGPIIGGFLGSAGGWRWVAALLCIFTGVFTVVGLFFLPETFAPVLLQRRAAKLSKATGMVYKTRADADSKVAPKELFKNALSRPWALLFKEPIVLLLSTYMAIIYGTLYLCFAAFPIVFEEQRGWSPGISGLAFLGVLVGFMLALLYIIFVNNPMYADRADKAGGWVPPEQRLIPAMIGGVLLPIGLFSFAWTAAPISLPWIAPIICTAPFGMGMVLVFLSIMNYLIDSYLQFAASVLAANSILRSLFGVVFPLFATPMYTNLGINWASTLVAFLALMCTPLPFLFYFYGARVRRMTKNGRHADDLGLKMKEMALKRSQMTKEEA